MERADLELVLSIRDAGSLTAAAAQLGIASPAVTKRLAALEAKLGLKLFYRTTRRVAATAEGELLCERAAGLLAGFSEAEEALRDQAREPSGQIRLAATFGFGRMWLGAALSDFQMLHPKVHIDLQLTERLPDLAAEGFDAAVWLWAPQANRTNQWSATLLAKNERVLVAAPSYVKARGKPRSLEDLQQHDCLQVRESDTPSGTWLLSKEAEKKPAQAIKVKGALVSNSGELVRDWCVSGRGIMLRSLWDVAPLIASGQLVRLLPGYAMRNANIQWLAPFRAQTPQRVRLLREHLMMRFKARPWE
ncbi:LysR family transcriptional regulator [Variovorax sp. PCZ-1]|uniref:LysR family transcriptional regulator n=1 Tax=Variovorax sp. PCZ-1 TaxID=2835533 RepID=UPI001BCD3AD9|nr:LysR family transcriptional regulator [Variovorax sp. PCZ-1]MBS7808261.1 LysR family transcriptional regulator [Variovorax sp. PCZ-1]